MFFLVKKIKLYLFLDFSKISNFVVFTLLFSMFFLFSGFIHLDFFKNRAVEAFAQNIEYGNQITNGFDVENNSSIFLREIRGGDLTPAVFEMIQNLDRAVNPYVNRGTHFELPVISDVSQGEKVIIEKDKAEMIIKGWNDEYAIKVIPQIPAPIQNLDSRARFGAEGKRELLSKKIEYRVDDVTAFVESRSGTEFDIDFTLHSKPNTNVFTYIIEGAEEFDFLYQGELTEEEIRMGAQRPENVVGSYAVYHKTKKGHIIGGTNYGTGKAFHIYRPKAIDANGEEAWAQLLYENGILSVTVPQEFLDTAVYPVIVDPTFGYTTKGGTFVGQWYTNIAIADIASLSEAGEVTKLSTWIVGSSDLAKAAIWNNDGSGGIAGTIVASGSGTSVTSDGSTALDFPFSSPVSLTAKNWGIGIVFGTDFISPQGIYYDSSGGIWAGVHYNNNYTTPTNFTTADESYSGFKFSIYATYELPLAITTQSATSVGETSATLNANITSIGGASATVRGFAWGTNSGLSNGDTATTTENGTFGTGTFSKTDLTFECNTTYYFRAYATNITRTSYGSILNFTTSACPILGTDLSGTAYQSVGGSTLNSKTIRVYKNGSTDLGSATTNASNGTWSMTTNETLSSGDVVTLFVDGDSIKANTVFVSDGLDKTGLNIYGGALIVRHETGSNITNANLHTGAIYGETDMVYATSTSNAVTLNSNIDLYVWTGDTYAPGATLTTQGTGGVYIESSATLTASNSHNLTIAGNFSNDGTFTHNNGTVVFNNASEISSISSSANMAFYNLTVTTAGKTIQFEIHTENVPTFSFDGQFTVTGQSGLPVYIQSTVPTAQWLVDFNVAQTGISNAYIRDSACAIGSYSVSFNITNSGGGNNGECWSFQNRGADGSGTITSVEQGSGNGVLMTGGVRGPGSLPTEGGSGGGEEQGGGGSGGGGGASP